MKFALKALCLLVGVIALPFILLFAAAIFSYGAAILISVLSTILVLVVGLLPLLLFGGAAVVLIVIAMKITDTF